MDVSKDNSQEAGNQDAVCSSVGHRPAFPTRNVVCQVIRYLFAAVFTAELILRHVVARSDVTESGGGPTWLLVIARRGEFKNKSDQFKYYLFSSPVLVYY